jgi:hypothetical protein
MRVMPRAETFREIALLDPDDFAVVLVDEGVEVARWWDVVAPREIWQALAR